MAKPAILVNLNRCTGCWTCSMACKVGNKLGERIEDWRLRVNTIGSGKGIDSPGGTWPDVWMSWEPIYTKKCTLCAERTAGGDQPFCTYNCPTKALTYGDMDDEQSAISLRMKELKDIGFSIFQKPEEENSSKNVYYAKR